MSTNLERAVRPGFWQMAAAEPFRIFFPVGVLFGISGVSLWPLYFLGIHQSFYPGVMHARMMIEGFLGAFVLGFLGTAVPRLTGGRPFTKRDLLMVLIPFVTATGLHIAHLHVSGDAVYLTTLGLFLVLLAKRFREREDLPPPSFVLVGFGFLNAILGTGLLIYGGLKPESFYAIRLGSMLLYQGFVLYLILGIGGFLLPRFLRLPAPELPESPHPSRDWLRKAAVGLVCGVILLGTFLQETFGDEIRAAYAIRWIAATAYLLWQLPLHRATGRFTLMRTLKTALILLILGLAFPVFWPEQRVAGLHVIFVGGFTLITFAVGTRVVLGHSGNQQRFTSSIRPLAIAALLLIAATLLRTIGDFAALQRPHLLNWASYLWMLAAIIWAVRILPLVRVPDTE